MIAAALLLQAVAPTLAPPAPQLSRLVVAMEPVREYDGLWFDQFEGQRFYPGVSDPRAIAPNGPEIWFGGDRTSILRAYVDARAPGAILPDPMTPTVYRIRFIGRQAQDMACKREPVAVSPCYGHMGSSPGLIVPDRILSIVDLGPVPRVSFDNRR